MAHSPFFDIEHHWAKASILQLAKRGWLVGGKRQQFRPDDRVTRAEFAALLPWVFPAAMPLQGTSTQTAPRLRDVPSHHPTSRAIAWVTQRGLLTGYADRTFRPDRWLTRSQAFVAVVRGLQTAPPNDTTVVLADYFDDAPELLDMLEPLQEAIATAALAGLVVSRLDIRKLRPSDSITRGELVALLDQLFGKPSAVPPENATSSIQLKDIRDPAVLPLSALKGNPPLVKDIQSRLHALRLYPGSEAINGQYTARTEGALLEFCRILELPRGQNCRMDEALAQTLLNTNPVCFALLEARDRPRIFQEFLRQEAGFSSAHLAFLDRGLGGSPYLNEVPTYPASFQQVPDGQTLFSLGESVVPVGSKRPVPFRPFPAVGELPQIDVTALDFLHQDIPQACLCIGSIVDGQLYARWLGRNALQNVQMWSATKFVPPLHIASRIGARFPNSDLDNCRVRPRGGRGFRFFDLMQDMVSYDNTIGSSNPIAAMFKQFDSPANLEAWVKRMTGNRNLQFRGRYGSNPILGTPEIWDEQLRQVVLRSPGVPHRGNNLISAYDLTRLISMLGWHLYLPSEAQLPNAQWNSLETILRSLGHDSARYVDVAIERLGISNIISSPVIISKLGFGRSSERNRTELVYTALVQFVDAHQCPPNETSAPPIMRMLSLTLVGVKRLGNGNREATMLDARMAAEITEILRRLVTQEMA